MKVNELESALQSGDQRPAEPNAPKSLDGTMVDSQANVAAGQVLSIGKDRYRVVTGLGGRLVPVLMPSKSVTRKVHLHCGLHKCLTMFQRKVYGAAARTPFSTAAAAIGLTGRPFQHHYHYVRKFYASVGTHKISSLSGQIIDLDSFDDIKVVRFIRDPRDLLVSGYHFHRRGAERINKVKGPQLGDYDELNAGIPAGIAADQTLAKYLQSVDLESGIAAEMEFRAPHFLSMMAWPTDDPRVLTVRYEDMMGHEVDTFERIGAHFGWGWLQKRAALSMARKYSAGKKQVHRNHIRNKASGQWRATLSPELNAAFVEQWQPLLEAYDYPLT